MLGRLALILLLALGAVPGIPGFDFLRQAVGQIAVPLQPVDGSRARPLTSGPHLTAPDAPGQPLSSAQLQTTDLLATLAGWLPGHNLAGLGAPRPAGARWQPLKQGDPTDRFGRLLFGPWLTLIVGPPLLAAIGLRWTRALRAPPFSLVPTRRPR